MSRDPQDMDREKADDAFEEWWNDEGEDRYGDLPQTKTEHRDSFVNGFLMGMGDR